MAAISKKLIRNPNKPWCGLEGLFFIFIFFICFCFSNPTFPSRSPIGSVPCVPFYTLSSPALKGVTCRFRFKHTMFITRANWGQGCYMVHITLFFSLHRFPSLGSQARTGWVGLLSRLDSCINSPSSKGFIEFCKVYKKDNIFWCYFLCNGFSFWRACFGTQIQPL